MGHPKRVRLSDIAERLDLSTVSISKALRGHPDISESTRQRVRALAEEMGYVPNRVARSLSSKQSKTLGVVLPKIAHSFFAHVLDGIQETAAEKGYEIILTVSRERAEEEQRHIKALLAMRVDGLLVSSAETPSSSAVYSQAKEMGVPLVFFDRVPNGLGFSTVTASDYEGAYEAVSQLMDDGYGTVAHLAGYEHLNIGRERRRGYEEALGKHGVALREEWIVEGGMNEADGYHGLQEIVETGEVPEAIFTVTFPVGLGALDALYDHFPEYAEEVRILSFGKHNFNRHLRTPFLCVEQPTHELGCRATELLIEEVNAGSSAQAPQHVELPTLLAWGGTDERAASSARTVAR